MLTEGGVTGVTVTEASVRCSQIRASSDIQGIEEQVYSIVRI